MSPHPRSIIPLILALLICLLPYGAAWGRDWVGDAGGFLASPGQWDGKDWARAGGVLLLTGLAFQVDDAVRNGFQANQSPNGDTLAEIGNGWGNLASLSGVTLLSIYGTGVATHDQRLVGLSANALEAIVLSGLATGIGKLSFGRLRPYQAADSHQWFKGGRSFPSGHTTAAFALSTVLAESGDAPSLGRRLFFYSLAGLTAMARMYGNHHWLSDTIMGAAIGVYSGLYVIKHHPLDSEQTVAIYPIPYGIGFTRRFDL